MNRGALILRNLRYHWRSNLAVALGVAIGVAVLAGALLVGDSLRGSLRDRASQQLGDLDAVLVAPHFFREELAAGFRDIDIVPAIVMRATVEVDGRRIPDVTVYGVVDRAKLVGDKTTAIIDPTTVHLSPALAAAVGTSTAVTLRLPKAGEVPRESTLGRKTGDDLTATLQLNAVRLNVNDPAASLRLSPGFDEPKSAFVNLAVLQKALGQEGRANGLFTSGSALIQPSTPLKASLTLDDYQLVLRTPAVRTAELFKKLDANRDGKLDARETRRRMPEVVLSALGRDPDVATVRKYFDARGSFEVESRSLILSEKMVATALDAAKFIGLRAEPAFVYLGNAITAGGREIPYSVIAAMDPPQPLADGEILLADWPESPLSVKPGDEIQVRYFLPESEGKAKENTATFKLKGFVPLAKADPFVTPEFPGITDKLTLGEWSPPFPYDAKKIQRRDEDYWEKYRATPKAYISANMGRLYFGSRFGKATSIRVVPKSPETMEADVRAFERAFLELLRPSEHGLAFESVRDRAKAASQGGTDFGGLFLAFSFYLIAAALMLIALLVRLNLDRRAAEVGLLLATGLRQSSIRKMWLIELLVVAAVGGLGGLALALVYAAGMLNLLGALWPEGQIGSFLHLHVTTTSLVIGYIAALVMTAGAVWWALRALKSVEPVALLRGVNADAQSTDWIRPRLPWISLLLLAIGGCLLWFGRTLTQHEAQAGAFFGGGAALLAAGIGLFRYALRRSRIRAHAPARGVASLGRRNAARNPGRSVLTAGLLAAATFLLVAVESFRRSPEADFASRDGGSGGFELIATVDQPLLQDLNDPTTGRLELLEALEKVYQSDPSTKAAKLAAAKSLLEATQFFPLRVHAGDDAGCRNLYQPTRPRLLGVPHSLIVRGGFSFKTKPTALMGNANPWSYLEASKFAAQYPLAFGEANTVTWMLKKSLGDFVNYESGEASIGFAIGGLLQDSPFPGELLISEARFLDAFPNTEGYGMLLIDAPDGQAAEVRALLDLALADHGVAIQTTAERLGAYLAVENTYLSTFQVLGGFGLLLGACGLAVVLLRSALERRRELALLRAVGFGTAKIGWMVFVENATILIAGLGIGLFAALVTVIPLRLAGGGGEIPVIRLAVLLGLVVTVGLLAGAWALRSVLRAGIVGALRTD